MLPDMRDNHKDATPHLESSNELNSAMNDNNSNKIKEHNLHVDYYDNSSSFQRTKG